MNVVLHQSILPCVGRLVLILIATIAAGESVGFAQEPPNSRPPKDDAEARAWLENMVWHHRMTDHEIRRATGWTFAQIDLQKARFNVTSSTRPDFADMDQLRVLPYPGGRHPRIGFLEGAIEPQRETKVSIFLPWDRDSYVVADVPEAIWSNLGLTYLAHTHIDTVWDEQGIELPPLEWEVEEDQLHLVRKLPNGITFDSRVLIHEDRIQFEMTLSNQTDEPLRGLRVQNCVMLKGAKGFATQANDNKRLLGPYATCHDESGKRWIITAWKPLHRCWANERCPCLHSDPVFPDCAAGETVAITGWLSFYEGTEIEAEIERIESLKWWE